MRPLAVLLAIAALAAAARWTSSLPDGLETVAAATGFADAAAEQAAPWPDYAAPGGDGLLATTLPGLLGALLCLGLGAGLAGLARRRAAI